MARNVKRSVFYVLVVVVIIAIGNFHLMLKKGPPPRSVSIYDQDEMEFAFDSDIGNEYFRTRFDAESLSGHEIMEYLNWKNENVCPDHQDLGGTLSISPKVCFAGSKGFATQKSSYTFAKI